MEDSSAHSARSSTPSPSGTIYLDHALDQLRADGYPVLDADVARLSPYMRRHINFHGRYSFALTNLGGTRQVLRDPDARPTPDAAGLLREACVLKTFSPGRRPSPQEASVIKWLV
jgi:hypothetical protein